jgi:hypothetical protein
MLDGHGDVGAYLSRAKDLRNGWIGHNGSRQHSLVARFL